MRSIRQFRYLFVDDEYVRRTRNLRRVVHQPEKYADNPVLRPEKPWETGGVAHFGTVLFDEGEGVFKFWYLAIVSGKERFRMDEREWGQGRSLLCYAISRDGVRWEKPNLGQVEFNGATSNNILRIGCMNAEGVAIRYEPEEMNPNRRYKAFFWEHGSGGLKKRDDGLVLWEEGGRDGMWIAFSPDGIHWSNYEDNPVVNIHSDTSHYVVRDPRTNRYMAYGRFGFARTVALVESDDFIHWSRPEQILEPDEHEPAGPFPATQFYGMTVDLYEGMYVGGLWIYREGTDGKIDTELASSRDGIHWNRVGDRQTFLPVSPEGTWGDGMVRPAANYIRRGEEIWIYFGMVDGPHSGPKFPGKSIVRKHPTGIGLGKLRRDGFVSLSAGTEPGALLTKPLWIDGPELHLNVEVEPGGKVEVGVCDLWSSLDPLTMDGAYPGLDHSVSMTQGSTNGVVHWPAADLRLQVGNKYRLKIRLESARIYSFWFE